MPALNGNAKEKRYRYLWIFPQSKWSLKSPKLVLSPRRPKSVYFPTWCVQNPPKIRGRSRYSNFWANEYRCTAYPNGAAVCGRRSGHHGAAERAGTPVQTESGCILHGTVCCVNVLSIYAGHAEGVIWIFESTARPFDSYQKAGLIFILYATTAHFAALSTSAAIHFCFICRICTSVPQSNHLLQAGHEEGKSQTGLWML